MQGVATLLDNPRGDIMLQAIGDRVIVEPVELPAPVELIVRVDTRKLYQIGRVVSVGDMVIGVDVGQYAWSRANCGLPLTYDNKDYLSLMQHEIIGISDDLA